MLILIFLTVFFLFNDTLAAEDVKAVRLTGSITIDGMLDEPVWLNAPAASGFLQLEPNEGAPATQQTFVRIAYDDQAIYVGADMRDTAPDSIIVRLSRRDTESNSDFFAIGFDTYHDKRSAFFFGVTAGGTMLDGILYNDDWSDDSWDGVWEGRVHRDNRGWTAELRIPLSQLRFQEKSEDVWGVNCRRDIARRNEQSYLAYTPKASSGFVSRFPNLIGIQDIHPSRHIEIMPYARTKAEYTHPESDDPFHDGSAYSPDTGLDVKMGLSQNLTMDLTVNPDFGQVEVDPAVVNLSDVETFFEEKRPFFIEGASTYRFGQGGASNYWGFNWASPDFFYSRRIGRPPQGSTPDYDYADLPEGAHILGAAKVTGKLAGNWNIGTLHALTRRETARLSLNGKTFQSEVEPMAYYGVFRAQKEIDKGLRGLGMISTMTARRFDESRLKADINGDAQAVGVDGWAFLDTSRTWVFAGWLGGSRVHGSPERMLALQENAQHYFQRPNSEYVHIDSSATTMEGLAGRFVFNKQKGNALFNSAFGFISPGFDVNDMGFFFRANMINGHIAGGYSWTKPGRVFRQATILGAAFQTLDYDMNITSRGVFGLGQFQFLNYMNVNTDFAVNPQTVNNNRTRGGPATLNPPGFQSDFSFHSDGRKPWVFGFSIFSYRNNIHDWMRSLDTDIEWKPKPNVSLSLGPQVSVNDEPAQWVGAFADPVAVKTFGTRYVFASMHQTEIAANLRLNWTFTPWLSLQLFVQPLISHGEYKNYKELDRPKSFAFDTYSGENVIRADGEYEIDPDGPGPSPSFTFDNPDFNFKSLRGNAVLRWEYRPGSTLYLVWTQSRSDDFYEEPFSFRHSTTRLFDARADNIFMIKASYWWGL
jgi:hypothetical protein